VHWIVRELARIAPVAAPAVLGQIVRQHPDPVLSDAVLRSVHAEELSPDPVLVGTSQRIVLQSIDDRLHRFISQ